MHWPAENAIVKTECKSWVMGVKNKDRRETPKAPPTNRRQNVMEKLDVARVERAKALKTPAPANDAGPATYAPPDVEIKVPDAKKVAPKRPTTGLTKPAAKKKASRANTLPELVPVDQPSLPVAAGTIVPRRVTKDGVIEPKPASVPAAFVAPEPPAIVDEDAELRAAIAAAFREFPEEEALIEEPRRRGRWVLLAGLLIGCIAAVIWGWGAITSTPPEIADTVPSAISSPAPVASNTASVAPAADATPRFAAAAGLPNFADVPQPYRISTLPLGPDLVSAPPPVLAMLDPTAAIAAPATDTRIIRGSATKLPPVLN